MGQVAALTSQLFAGKGELEKITADLRLLSHTMYLLDGFRNPLSHKTVNSFFILVTMKDKLTDLCGNRLLHNELEIISCEITLEWGRWQRWRCSCSRGRASLRRSLLTSLKNPISLRISYCRVPRNSYPNLPGP